nr:hypothetical protein [Kibdelosporangium sp. MJ126-NF4]CEL14328.1 hypothetical protein [Kibdelosporangium sp. MJ126-NF4]CTQ88695.1 hypothetical protein [Kibdelosporangium sp. MJ126-NF4]
MQFEGYPYSHLAQAAPGGSLTEKIVLIVLGALVGFGFTYALDRIKARREPRHRVSWDLSLQRALVEVNQTIRPKVSFAYNGNPVTALAHLRCTVSNTGNRVVKNHEVRFPFADDVKVLDKYIDPKPDEELGVELIERNVTDGDQYKYRIKHLERGQSVVFHFVVEGTNFGDWHPRSFNPDGDVDFQRRDIAIEKDDQQRILPFIITVVLAIAIPAALEALNSIPGFGYFSAAAIFLTRIILVAAVLLQVRPIVRMIQRRITPGSPGHADVMNSMDGRVDGHVIQIGTMTGDMTLDPRKDNAANAGANGQPAEPNAGQPTT